MGTPDIDTLSLLRARVRMGIVSAAVLFGGVGVVSLVWHLGERDRVLGGVDPLGRGWVMGVHVAGLAVGWVVLFLGWRALSRLVREMEAEEGRSREVLDSLAEHIAVLDERGYIVAVNAAWRRFAASNCGVGPEVGLHVGASYLGVCHTAARREGDDDARAALVGIESVISGRSPSFEMEYPCDAPGCPRWFEMRVRPLLGVRRGVVVSHEDISARKKAEAAVRESEERLRGIVEDSEAGYFRVGVNGRFEAVNGAWLRMHGFGHASEVIGQPFSLTQVPADLGRAQLLVSAGLRGERMAAGEFTRRHRDGSIGHHSYSIRPVCKGGEVVGLEGFLIDTTRLRETQEHLAMVFEQMIDGFALHELVRDETGAPVDYRFVDVNPAFERLTGLSAATVVGRTQREVLPDEDPQWLEIFARVVRTGDGEVFERYSVALGRHFEVSAFSPGPGRFACVFLDVTDRRRAETQLRQLSRAVEQSPVSIVITDAEGRIEYVNPKFTEVTGYTAAEALGQNPRILKSGEQSPDTYRELWATLAAGREWRGELHNRKKDGELYWEYASISAVRDPNGRVTHYVAVKEDITSRRRMEDQLRQAQKMDAVGRLAGGIAHDFNNILAAGMMNVGLLRDEPGLGAEARELVQELEAEFRRATSLTRQLLVFGRRSVLQVERLDLNEVVENLLRMLRRLIGENVSLEFVPGVGLPGVSADAGMMEQVLMNLAVNARDAMPGGGRIRVTTSRVDWTAEQAIGTSGRREGRFVRLSVSDDGCGMDEATRLHIFEPFFTTKAAGKGTGLGLATVYGIVDQHRGWIEVESAPGRGTTFHVHLPPVEGPVSGAGGAVAEAAPYSEGSIPRGTESILLVEDEVAVRRTVAQCLRLLGYRVMEAANATEAFTLWEASTKPVDLLFSDMVLPGGMTGGELANRLREKHPGLKVILSSGYPDADAGAQVRNDGGFHYLPKPFPAHAMGHAVRACLDGRTLPARAAGGAHGTGVVADPPPNR